MKTTNDPKPPRYPQVTAGFEYKFPFHLLAVPYRLCGKPLTQQERLDWERKGA